MHADALPDLPLWACQDCGRSCAPDVQLHDGVYYMYFLTYLAGVHKRNCIGVATSRTATGPYEPRGDKPIVCDGALTGTAMDPRSFDHEDGSIWLYYGSHHDPIMAGRLAPSRLTLMGPPVPVLQPDNSSYGSVTEGPWVYKDAAGELTMFYSGSQCCGPRLANLRNAGAGAAFRDQGGGLALPVRGSQFLPTVELSKVRRS